MDHAKVVPHLARHLPRGFVARIYVSVALALDSALFCCGEDLPLGARERHAAPSRNLTTLMAVLAPRLFDEFGPLLRQVPP